MSTHTFRRVRTGATPTFVLAGLLLLSACGSGYGSSTPSAAQGTSGGSASGTTVTVHDASGMRVLATSSGQTLYASSQENGRALCTSGACRAVWVPLTVSSGKKPTAPSSVAPHLSTIAETNGLGQVAYDGQPLYTFAYDHGAGQVNGNGQHDSFDGTSFTWHVATPTGTASTSSGSSGSSDSPHRYGY